MSFIQEVAKELLWVGLIERCPRNASGIPARLMPVFIVVTFPDDHKREHKAERKRHHNYIIEQQEAYQVEGVPTERMIIGKREIDIYPNGMMFEGNNVVGVRTGR